MSYTWSRCPRIFQEVMGRHYVVYCTYVHDVQQESLRITARQVAQVCDTLEQAGDTSRLARFLWSLPTDARSTLAFNQFEPVLRARALVAFHGGHFQHLYRILTTYRFARIHLHTIELHESFVRGCLNFAAIEAYPVRESKRSCPFRIFGGSLHCLSLCTRKCWDAAELVYTVG